eukprot:1927702-Pyramimonas_sp.AAC.1
MSTENSVRHEKEMDSESAPRGRAQVREMFQMLAGRMAISAKYSDKKSNAPTIKYEQKTETITADM